MLVITCKPWGEPLFFFTMRHQPAGGIGLNTTVLSEDLSMPDATLQDNEGEADASENDDKDESDAVDSEKKVNHPRDRGWMQPMPSCQWRKKRRASSS